MKIVAQRMFASLSIMAALAGAVVLNAAEASAVSNTCAVAPFIPALCAAPAVGPAAGVAAVQNQPVVDFLGVADANAADGLNCRAEARYLPPAAPVSTLTTAGLLPGTSAFPALSAAGWYPEPGSMVNVFVECI